MKSLPGFPLVLWVLMIPLRLWELPQLFCHGHILSLQFRPILEQFHQRLFLIAMVWTGTYFAGEKWSQHVNVRECYASKAFPRPLERHSEVDSSTKELP